MVGRSGVIRGSDALTTHPIIVSKKAFFSPVQKATNLLMSNELSFHAIRRAFGRIKYQTLTLTWPSRLLAGAKLAKSTGD